MEEYEYGVPIYLTVNASEMTEPIDQFVQRTIHHANKHRSALYVTVNSGKPLDPPPTPPGNG